MQKSIRQELEGIYWKTTLVLQEDGSEGNKYATLYRVTDADKDEVATRDENRQQKPAIAC